jgi:hypothetical protein
MTRLRLLAICLSSLLGGNAWADLRTFDVQPEHQEEVYNALREVLSVASSTSGKVERLPTGQLIVNASSETLDQVEQVLQAIRNRPASAAPRADLSYWAVLGSRRGPAAANPPGAPVPGFLNDVLGELQRMHGDLEFRVLGTASLTTQSGQFGEIAGTTLRVGQRAFVQGETLNAEIELVSQALDPFKTPNTVNVRTAVRAGEFVVLGQAEVTGDGGLVRPIFFIVHWPARAR